MTTDIDSLRTNGLAFLNSNGSGPSDAATIIVVGVARSGTSMVAKCLRELGVYLGDRADGVVHEDVEIARALDTGDEEELENLIADRDLAHPLWGFKRPTAYRVIDRYIGLFRNPRLVIPFRDPLAIAQRNQVSMQMDFLLSLNNAARDISELVSFVEGIQSPAMLVSYEKALFDPHRFVLGLQSFCGIKASQEVVSRASASVESGPTNYLSAARLRFEGSLDKVAEGVAYGWVRCIGQAAPQTVILLHNGREVGRGKADRYREDLKQQKKQDGHCAFRIGISDNDLTKKDVVAKVLGSNFVLFNGNRIDIKN